MMNGTRSSLWYQPLNPERESVVAPSRWTGAVCSTRSSTWSERVVPGGCCPVTLVRGRPSMATSGFGAKTGRGSSFTTSCGILNLVRAVLLLVAQLQPVERRRTGQRDSRRVRMHPVLAQGLTLVDRHRQQRIMPQRVVIVEILIAQHQPIQALVQQLFQGVIAIAHVPPVDEGPGQTPGQPQTLVQLAHQQDSAVVGQIAPRKIRLHFARPQGLKEHQLVITVCRILGGRM